MSRRQSSDSEGSSWAMVDRPEDDSDTGHSHSSTDFVKVQGVETVSYHHKDKEDQNNGELSDDGAESALPAVDMEDEEAVADDEASSIEELNLTQLDTQHDDIDDDHEHISAEEHGHRDDNLAMVHATQPRRVMKPRLDSESEHSDFIRLEAPSLSEMEDDDAPTIQNITPRSVMRISTDSCNSASSSTSLHTATSSISSSFRFVPSTPPAPVHVPPLNPVLVQQEQQGGSARWHRYFRRPLANPHADDLDEYALHSDHSDSADADDVPSDVDDRCESDISGVAVDDDDGDVFAGDEGEIPLSEGNVRRSYRHQTNNNLNSVLNTLAIMALFSALGIGVGHFLGIQRELGLRRQQEVKMRDLQDDYLLCLRHKDSYWKQINDPLFPDNKMNAITGVWKQKYEDLIVEKVELEQLIQDLQQQLEEKTEIAQLQAENHASEMDRLQEEMSGMKVQHSTRLVHAEVQLAEAREEDKYQQTELEELSHKLAMEEEKNRDLLASLETPTIDTPHHLLAAEIQAKEEKLHKMEEELMNKEAELVSREAELTTKEHDLAVHHVAITARTQEMMSLLSDGAGAEHFPMEPVVKTERDLTVSGADTDNLLATTTTSQSESKGDNHRNPAKPMVGADNTQTGHDHLTAEKPSRVYMQKEGELVINHAFNLVMVKVKEIAELKKELTDVRVRYEEVTTALAERNAQMSTVGESGDLMVYKEEVNQLRHENQDLKTRLSTVLYRNPGMHQQSVSSTADSIIQVLPADDTTQDVDIEILEDEDAENGTDSPHCSPPQFPSDAAVASKDHQLLQEQLRSTQSQLEEAEARADSFQAQHKECLESAPTHFLSCMRLLLPNTTGVNATEFMWRLLQDERFSKAMEQRWSEFYVFLQQGAATNLPDKVKQVYADLERTLQAKYREFAKKTANFDIPKKFANEQLQSVVNKTKATVSKLSEKIQNTWHKVKDASSDVLKGNEKLSGLKDSLVKNVEKVGDKVRRGWDKVVEHVHTGFFNKKKHTEENRYKNHPQDHYGNSPYAGHEREETQQQQQFAKTESQVYGSKADNKQTQSASLEQKYEEFWKRANFDPDDYVAEDFFQGNHREWKKQQKSFKKLYGRIYRLNEDMLYSMDDDDIEDIYDDLEDFEEDYDDLNKQAGGRLNNWLSCQIRWWKSRIQRKHRSAEFVKGCGAQLMRWQLRAMCKPISECNNKKCKREKRGSSDVEACHQLLHESVIQHQQQKPSAPQCQEQQAKDSNNNETVVVNEFTMETKPRTPNPSVLVKPGSDFILIDTPHRRHEQKEDDASWVWERYHSREYLRQDKPGWQFKRANDRAFEREKPWYYKRADQRKYHHIKHD